MVVSPLISLMKDQVDALNDLRRPGGLPRQHASPPSERATSPTQIRARAS